MPVELILVIVSVTGGILCIAWAVYRTVKDFKIK